MKNKIITLALIGLAVIVYILVPKITRGETYSLSDIAEFTGAAGDDYAGSSVSSAGDVDGDGYEDFLVGAYGNDYAGSRSGIVYLIYGSDDIFEGTNSLSSYAKFTGPTAFDMAGYSVSNAGDVDSDGYSDFLISAYGDDTGGSSAGAVYLIYGSGTKITGTHSLSSYAKFTGESADDYAGYAVSDAGDIDDDGYSDFLVGAYGDDAAGTNAGAVYLIYGSGTKITGTHSLSSYAKFTGDSADDNAGKAISGAGDVDSDGYEDFLVGVKYNDHSCTNGGAVYLIYGASSKITGVHSLTDYAELNGVEISDYAGTAVSGAGDVDSDGYSDFLVGASGNDAGGSSAGVVYLIYGSSIRLTGSHLLSAYTKLTGEAENNFAGTSLSSIGDADSDGYDDFLVGAEGNSSGGSGAGAVYLIYGSEDRITSTHSLSTYAKFSGEGVNNYAGSSVSGAGDVNHDGYSDILIGANGNSDGGASAGAAYIGYIYIDADGDSQAGNAGILDGLDCDDTNGSIYSGALEIWYDGIDSDCNGLSDYDADADGYDVIAYGGTDCDDNDDDDYITYYQDSDGDGLGSDVTTCSGASTPTGYVSNSTDTNDNDYDNDGSETGTDCDDDNALIQSEITYYIDADHDNYGSATTADLCSLTAPTGYATNNTDCNDSSASIHSNQTYYYDADGDGLGSDTTTSACQLTA
ncbi:MAG: MopE-related protein, partial [Patescibacteria group bacterium]